MSFFILTNRLCWMSSYFNLLVSSIACRIKYFSVQYFVSYVYYVRMYFYVFFFLGLGPTCQPINLTPTPPKCMDTMHVPSPTPCTVPSLLQLLTLCRATPSAFSPIPCFTARHLPSATMTPSPFNFKPRWALHEEEKRDPFGSLKGGKPKKRRDLKAYQPSFKTETESPPCPTHYQPLSKHPLQPLEDFQTLLEASQTSKEENQKL